MRTRPYMLAACLCLALLLALAHRASAEEATERAEPSGLNPGIKYSQEREVSGVRPHKPVQIKLKRAESGKVGWEITGDSAEAVIEADRKLRDYTKK